MKECYESFTCIAWVSEMLRLTVLLCFYCGVICIFGKQFAGPYVIKFKSFYMCDYVGEASAKFSTKIRKINRTHHSYTSNVTLEYGWGDDIAMKIDVFVWGNGGWRPNFLNLYTEHACSSGLRMFPGLGQSFLGAAGYNFTKCPVPPGVYEVKNWIFNMHFGMNIVPYGKYKFQGSGYRTMKNKTKIMTSCAIGELDVVPVSRFEH